MNDGTCHCEKYGRDPVRVGGACVICNPGPYVSSLNKRDEYEPAWSWAKEEFRADMRRAIEERVR